MTYQQTVLNSKPAGFWMITAPSGTSETDLSGNGKTATITEATDLIDRANLPLVQGTTSDRAYRFYTHRHKITYPVLEAWEINRDHIPFSIETTYQWIDGVREQVLFAPQEASSTNVYDNELAQKDGLLRFAVSSGVPGTKRAEASYQLEPGRTYHIIAIYDGNKVSLYIDGVLVDQDAKDPSIKFGWTTANFLSQSMRGNLDPTTSQFLLDAVSFYRRVLTPTEINNHFVNSTPNVADLDQVNSTNGKLIKANQEDMTKVFDFSARTRGWTISLNDLGGMVVDDQGNLSLKQIKPVKLITGPNYSGNLLGWNHSSVEIDTTGFVNLDSTPTLTRSTAQASHGSASMSMVATATAITSVGTSFATSPAVTPGKTYTAHVAFRQNVFTSGTYRTYIIWRTTSGVLIQSVGSATVTPSTSWQRATITAVAPANAAYAQVAALMQGHAIGDSLYADEFGLWEGTSTTWNPPSQFPITRNTEISPKGNMLLVNAATADVDTTGQALSAGSQTLTRDTTVMQSGAASWKIAISGSTTAAIAATVVAVKPGQKYTQMAKGIGTVARTMNQYTNFFDASGALIGNGGIQGATLSTTAWTQNRRVITAPPNAVTAQLNTQVASVLAGENYWFDELGFFEGDVASYTPPIFNSDEINLQDSRMVLADQIGQYLGQGQGAIGGFMDFTALANDNIGEQVVASVSDSARTNYFEIVKKTDENLYLRYVYRDQTGAIATLEDSYGAISGLLGGMPYWYLEWTQGSANLYINDQASSAEIVFDAGIPAPHFDFDAYVVIGGGVDKTRTWNTMAKFVKLYDQAQTTNDFVNNKTSTNGYTLKLTYLTELNVSQALTAKMVIPTGSDGTDDIAGTSVEYEPRNSSIVVKTTDEVVENLVTPNQASVEAGTTTGFSARGTGSVLAATQVASAHGAYSLRLTCAANPNQGANVGTGTGNWVPATPGTTFTGHAAFLSAATSRTFTASLTFWNSGGSFVSQITPVVSVASSTSVWNTVTVSGVVPATAVYVGLALEVSGTPAASEVHYFDKMGIWEGTDTTWAMPLQTVTHGSEATVAGFNSILPTNYYASVALSTDDSYYNVEHLRDLRIKAFSPDTILAENSPDEIITPGRSRVFDENLAVIRQGNNNGIFTDSMWNRFYIKRVVDSDTAAVPDGGTSGSTPGPSGDIRTLEFWVRPETQGYYFYHDGATEYSLRYYDAGGFTTTGFTTLYVDGAAVTNGTTSTTWYNRWHHIVLTNASAQINLATDFEGVNNLLTANMASLEAGATTGWAFSASTGTAINTIHAPHGSYVLSVNATNTTGTYGRTATGVSGIPVLPGVTYTFTGKAQKNAANTGSQVLVRVAWYNAAGGAAGGTIDSSVTAVTSTGWTQVTVTGVSPATAAYATVHVMHAGTWIVGDIMYWDEMGLWEGSSLNWSLPGSTRPLNLLTPNQASGGDTLGSTLGFTNHTSGTMSYDTTQQVYGAGSIKHSALTPGRHSTSTSGTPVAVQAGKTYTAQARIRSGAAPTGGYGWRLSIEWLDDIGNTITSTLFNDTLVQDVWKTMTVTGVAPLGATRAYVLMYRNNAAGGVAEDAWMDNIGLWEGTSTEWTPADPKGWFGSPPHGGNQARAKYQNIAYYPQSFAAGDVTTALKGYLGDATGGSVSDSEHRSVSDLVNILTVNEATAETDLTGIINGGATVTRVTSDKDEGIASFQAQRVSGGAGQSLFTIVPPGADGSNRLPTAPGEIFTLACSVKATVGGAMAGSMKLTIYNSGGGYLTDLGAAFTTSGSWQRIVNTVTMPASAAYFKVEPYFMAGANGDTVLFDRMMVARGRGNAYVHPSAITTANPKTFADLWEIQSVPVA